MSWWRRDSTSEPAPPAGIKKISDSVYLLSEPSPGPPGMEIVFIHGLQLSDYQDAYWKTWIAGEKGQDGKEIIWPMAWLGKEFPRARILSLKYDSSAWKTSTQGRMDGYSAGESLVQEIVEFAHVGAQPNCPIVFVCHSLGGLIVKEIIIRAKAKSESDPKYVSFLQNIRGYHFYAVPHDGSKLADLASNLPNMGPMVKKLRVINDNLGRLNAEFEHIQKNHFKDKWKLAVVAEKHATQCYGFSGMVVEETSARHGHEKFFPAQADHFGVCKPPQQNSSSYKFLTNFIAEVCSAEQTSSITRTNPGQAQQMSQEDDLR